MKKTELLQALAKTKSQTASYFDLSDTDMIKTYAPGKWNVRQILHHLTDAEILMNGRIKKVIAEPFQVIWAFNQDDWDKTFNYATMSLKGKKEQFLLFRDMNTALAEEFYETLGEKTFVHNETGMRTLAIEFQKVASHCQGHLNQIEKAINE
jgi:hypothetical protein